MRGGGSGRADRDELREIQGEGVFNLVENCEMFSTIKVALPVSSHSVIFTRVLLFTVAGLVTLTGLVRTGDHFFFT